MDSLFYFPIVDQKTAARFELLPYKNRRNLKTAWSMLSERNFGSSPIPLLAYFIRG